MECTAENLERVVTLFYRSEAGQQAQAHQWLTSAQNSPQAWSFVWELLQSHRSSEVQFFAATTLHTKLLKHWNEVPTDHYEQLKKKIVENIINYAMGPKIVLNRLCIALSAYIIHTIPNHWPNAFEELVSSFQPQNLPNINSERVTWILLEILTVIPEEFTTTTLPSTQRTRVRAVLQDVSRSILQVVEGYLGLGPTTTEQQTSWTTGQLTTWLVAARCAAAWLGGIGTAGETLADSAGVAQALVGLICRVYWAGVTDSDGDELELIEAASEALGALLAHPAAHKQPVAVAERLQDVVPPLALISSAELVKPPRTQNRDVLCCVAGLLVGAADTHSKLLVEWLAGDDAARRDLALQVIRAVLALSGAPGRYPVDESASALTWGVWYTLQDDALALGADGALHHLKPLYRELAGALLRKAAFPGDYYDRYTSDEQELFRCYRQDVADTLLYCGAVLGPELGALLGARLTAALDAGPQAWPAVEATLLAHQAVAEEALVPRLMQVLSEIPYASLPPRVLSTALDTCGAHAEWLEGGPLTSAVQLLCAGLAQPAVTASASLALKDVAHAAQRALAPHAPCLLAACQTALEVPQLRLAEATRLMFSVGKLLGALPPQQQQHQNTVMDYLNVILAPHFTELQLLLNQPASNTTATCIVTRLKMVSALFMALQNEGPDGGALLVVAGTTMPLYEALGARWSTHGAVLDALCTLLRHVVTGLSEAGAPLAPALLALLGQAYRAALHPAPLHVARLLLLLWGPAAAPLLAELAAVSVELDPTLAQHIDALEAWWATLAQLTRKAPRLLMGPGIDPSLLMSRSSLCLSRPELPLLKASASFLAAFVLQARELGLQDVVLAGGEALVGRVLASLAGAAPRSAAEPLADVLLALNKRTSGDSLARWLATGLALCPTCPPAQRETFARAVLRERANKRRLTEAVLEFTLICRGILRPDQQQQQQQQQVVTNTNYI